ncbi:diguanylate cyclase [Sedimenticola hydrogenitrophicus]|uniref:GGDEF domain-containing response regulator n=1 Tax=Sedimenticola hydrogenitrophicus TaxID=2967975 RepID=UPI0021A8C22E|nr:diguanylate cyclase [Sedimenticola hydrogenitrophicus]
MSKQDVQIAGSDKSLQVLIADDERIPRRLLVRMVENWGYQAVEAETGLEAWQILSQPEPPRIAIIDWLMPGMSGVEICHALQQRNDAPLIYTILLTSKSDEAAMVYALEQGAHDFQSKPANPAELRVRLLVGKRLINAEDRLNESLARLELMAATDALTGVANRRHFFQLAAREFARADRAQTPMALMMIDIDNFKQINDNYGHAAGDSALLLLVEVCRKALRGSDIIARFGGDEFVILLPDCDVSTAIRTGERLLDKLRATRVDGGEHPFCIQATVGIATSRHGGGPSDDIAGLLHRADQALYAGKKLGRNRVAVCDSE